MVSAVEPLEWTDLDDGGPGVWGLCWNGVGCDFSSLGLSSLTWDVGIDAGTYLRIAEGVKTGEM